MKKKLWTNILRVAISVGGLAYVFLTNDWRQILAELGQADWRCLLGAFAIYVLSLIVRAFRWFVLVRKLAPNVSFGRLLRLYFVGQFFSTFLPSIYGGDVIRAVELTQDTDTSAAIGTVLLDRLTGLMMLALMGLVALPFQAAAMEPWLAWTMLSVMLAVLIGGTLLIEGRLLRWLTGWLPARLSLAGQGTIAKVYAAITGCGWQAVAAAFGVSVVFNLMNVGINWLCGLAVDTGISLATFFVISTLFSIAGMVPSIGGWGVRETLGTIVFESVSNEKAAAWGVALNLIALAAGLVGGVVYAAEGVLGLRESQPQSSASE